MVDKESKGSVNESGKEHGEVGGEDRDVNTPAREGKQEIDASDWV